MAIEQVQTETVEVSNAEEKSAADLTWAEKWDMWWWRVLALGWMLTVLDQAILAERAVSGASWGVKADIAAPLATCLLIALVVWRARRAARVGKQLAESVFALLGILLFYTYQAMGDLRHLWH